MQELINKAAQNFRDHFNESPELFSQAPGRINIIGEHVDYTGGFCLPAAINRWTVCAWGLRPQKELQIYSSNMNELWKTTWDELESSMDKSWKKYIGGALSLFKERYFRDQNISGLNLSLHGDVPLGKGVSSSASLELSVLNGLNRLYKADSSPLDLTLMAQQIEHRFLNLKSGLLDQFASQFSAKDKALLIDFKSLRFEQVAMASEYLKFDWVVVDSCVERELASSKYSERVEECAQIDKLLKLKDIESIREVKLAELDDLLGQAPSSILKRARHIVSENLRTLAACEALKQGRTKNLGELLYQSHLSLTKDYEVSHSHLDFLVELSKNIEGVLGGRMMGGGFGGCCVFLVEKQKREEFNRVMSSEYKKFSAISTAPLTFQFVDGASAFS